jgi:hypothetical protein
VRLVEQWNGIENGLDPSWSDARLSLRIEDARARERAAALLGPAGPGFSGDSIRFYVTRTGRGIGPEAARRLLGRVDGESIAGELTLVSSSEAEPAAEIARPTLAAEWQAALAVLPSDWSDLVAELELESSADVDRAAVLCAPLNPIQAWLEASPAKPSTPSGSSRTPSASGGGRPGFRLRCASTRGYGASAGMIERCLTRLDEEEIRGRVRITRVLSDVHPVGTQGATFLVGRRPA